MQLRPNACMIYGLAETKFPMERQATWILYRKSLRAYDMTLTIHQQEEFKAASMIPFRQQMLISSILKLFLQIFMSYLPSVYSSLSLQLACMQAI